jgi:hypothetical protein
MDAPDSSMQTATVAQLQHVPTALERRADPADLDTLRKHYGSRAQTLINTCLAFDGYFEW